MMTEQEKYDHTRDKLKEGMRCLKEEISGYTASLKDKLKGSHGQRAAWRKLRTRRKKELKNLIMKWELMQK